MHAENLQGDQPNNLARQQQSIIRVIGAFIGRAIMAIGVGLAVRLYKRRQQADVEGEDAEALTPKRILHEFKEEAAVSAATILTWNLHLGGETGANVSEYLVDRLSHVANQNYAVLPQYATPRTTLVADRVADNFLWRFANSAANYASGTLPETTFSMPGNTRQEGLRFF